MPRARSTRRWFSRTPRSLGPCRIVLGRRMKNREALRHERGPSIHPDIRLNQFNEP